MKQNFALLALLFLFVFSSCDSSKDTTGPDNTNDTVQIQPLKIGNNWVYLHEYYFSDGEIDADTLKDSISAMSVINGEQFYRVNSSDYYFINRADGLWDFGSSEFYHLAKYPCKVGDLFTTDTLIFNNYDTLGNVTSIDTAIGTNKVVAINEIISVHGKPYSCVRYEQNYYLNRSSTLYVKSIRHYAPSIGMVKIEHVCIDENRINDLFSRWVISLLSYVVN
jgi:hypothetical protein